jgi:hypothetical protein
MAIADSAPTCNYLAPPNVSEADLPTRLLALRRPAWPKHKGAPPVLRSPALTSPLGRA